MNGWRLYHTPGNLSQMWETSLFKVGMVEKKKGAGDLLGVLYVDFTCKT